MTEAERLIANQKYWSGRTQKAAHGLYATQEEKTAAYLSNYTKAYNKIEKETAALYAKYSYKGELSRTELYKYERNTKYIEQLKKICTDLGASEEAFMKTSFESLYQSAMKNTVEGFGIDFGKISQKQMDQILNHPWSGADYSSRLWKNKEDLVNKLSQTVTRGAIQGKSITDMSRELRSNIESSAYDARRLIRTESMHFINQGQLDGYRRSGVTQVEILAASDERTCPTCGGLNGEIVDIAKADSVLPAHAQCRCTYCPVVATMKIVPSSKNMSAHALEQAKKRGISTDDINDACAHPLKSGDIKYDEYGRKSIRNIGKKAEIAYNPDTGIIASVNPTHTKKAQKLMKEKQDGI